MSALKATPILSLLQATEARLFWLMGYSLRTLAPRYGMTHNMLHSRLKQHFGKDCCSRKANSLSRSLLRDGYSLDEIKEIAFKQGNEWLSSYRQDNTYSKQRMLDFTYAIDSLSYDDPSEPNPLDTFPLLPWFTLVNDVITSHLYFAMVSLRETAL